MTSEWFAHTLFCLLLPKGKQRLGVCFTFGLILNLTSVPVQIFYVNPNKVITSSSTKDQTYNEFQQGFFFSVLSKLNFS